MTHTLVGSCDRSDETEAACHEAAVKELIEAKRKGKPLPALEPEPRTPGGQYQDALPSSLSQKRKRRGQRGELRPPKSSNQIAHHVTFCSASM
jgi:hypothetical protein